MILKRTKAIFVYISPYHRHLCRVAYKGWIVLNVTKILSLIAGLKHLFQKKKKYEIYIAVHTVNIFKIALTYNLLVLDIKHF